MNNFFGWIIAILLGLWVISPIAYFAYTNNEIKKLREEVKTYRGGITVITAPEITSYDNNKFMVVGVVDLGNGIRVPAVVTEDKYTELIEDLRLQYVKAMSAQIGAKT